MTFAEVLSECYADLNYAASPAATEVARIKRYVNEGLRVILGEPALVRLLDSDAPLTVASVASTARVVVPEAVARIHHITERTNARRLEPMSLAEYRQREPDPASHTGTPTHYVPIGRVAVAKQPADASEIFVDSTAAGDTNTCYIEGITTGGYMKTASVNMTGVTAVTLSAAITDFIEITDFYLSAAAVGTVTLHEDASGGTELARITIGAKRPRYYAFYLFPTPSAAVTYYVDYRREMVELVNDTDEPPLPTDYHYLLSAYVRMRQYEKTDDSRWPTAREQFLQGLSRLKYATQTLADDIPVMGRGRVIGRSRLGGYFPADFWS